ncbi:MAG TPA: DUF5916 domain-containing protein [Gemmatimonadales bacterium]|nr:DUF5916 domain-containing protein [Gemmatimonadales bacterium]
MPAILLALLVQGPVVDSAALRHANGLVPPAMTAVRVPRPPAMDGRLDDPLWSQAVPVTDLRQSDPHEGAAVSESTEVRILYTDDALYIGARLFDREPGKIAHHLGRRDSFTQSDDFRVLIDSYHDHRTAFRFDVTPLGVKNDLQFGDDGNFSDNSFDPVWEAATSIDSLGWTAEYRIPFSQLRFSQARDQVWGIRFVRTILRKNEFAMWPFIGKTESGFVSRFGHLLGLHDIPSPKRLELLPYSLARGTYAPVSDPLDPFQKSAAYAGNAGLDLKYGITSNLTLDATLNPDFGQVELDPAFVNLSAFEQFLPEHRPFFVEGADIFNFGGGSGGFLQFGNAPQFFYSRRIGRPPHGGPYDTTATFFDVPENTTILGAGKLTGRSPSGWSLGVIDAVTGREQATGLDTLTGARTHDDIEPTTNYFTARARRTLNGGSDGFGFIATAVNRDLRVPELDFLRTSAYDWGVDFHHRWGGNAYAIAGDFGGSYITGDTTAIQSAQLASARYYQRPDAHAFHYDPARTSLGGFTGDLYLDKLAGDWLAGAATSITSPGFEVNDLGFQRRVDRIANGVYVARHWTKPGPIFREATLIVQGAPSFNFDGDMIQKAIFLNSFGNLRNFWFFSLNAGYNFSFVDDRLTRGGPDALAPANWQLNAFLQTDQRKAVTGSGFGSYQRDHSGGWQGSVGGEVDWRPSSAIALSLAPSYSVGRTTAQYVATIPDSAATATYGAHYVFAQLYQHELDLTLRANATFSPTLSLEVFTQPFSFSGDYGALKQLAAPRSFSFVPYADTSGAIGNQDFRTRSLRVNSVLRWEYRPGSTLFVVWTQSRSGFFGDPSFEVNRDFNRELFRDPPTNVLLVKLNYWMSL